MCEHTQFREMEHVLVCVLARGGGGSGGGDVIHCESKLVSLVKFALPL